MTATTPTHALRYPDDYNAPADVPSAMRDLALDTDAALAGKAQPPLPSTTWVADGQLSAAVFTVPGSLAPGQEMELGPFGINPGTYCVCTPQFPSTYIVAVYNDRGDGTAVIKVRNTTAATTHSNVKVHAIFVNLPG